MKCIIISIYFLQVSLTAHHICICSIFTFHNLQVAALSKVGGDVVGQTVRRILRKISTAGVWSEYSRVGKSGKCALTSLNLYAVIYSEYSRNFGYITSSYTEHVKGSLR